MLTLCTSIMSVVHGVFIVLGALPVSSGASPALPVTIVAMMPIISAMVALLGGIIAFARSKWSIIFLFAAAVACAFGSQDVWLYGGAYFFAGILCFFLRKKTDENDFMSDLYTGEGEYSLDPSAELNSEDDYNEEVVIPKNRKQNLISLENNEILLDDNDIEDFENESELDNENNNLKLESEPVKIRVRTSKSCPTCGNIVSREVKFCPNCGTKLYVDPSLLINENTNKNSETETISDTSDEILKTDSFQDTNEILKDITELAHDSDSDSEEIKSEIQSENIEEQPEIKALNQNDISLSQLDESQNIQNFFDDDTPTSISNLLGRNQTKSQNSDYNNNNNEMESEQEVYKVSGSHFAQRKKINAKPIKNKDTASYKEFSTSKYIRRGKKRKSSLGKRVLSSLMLLVAVGGSLYFLLSLRKLPAGDLPPIARNEVLPTPQEPKEQDFIAQPVGGETNNNTVKENILPAFNPEQNPKNGIITGNGVNMRSDHSLVARPVTKLSNNTRFEILDSWTGQTGTLSGTWYQVRTSNNREGWVYGRYVQLSGSGLPNGYSNALMKSFGSNKSELIESLGNPTRSTATSAEWQGLTASLRGNEIIRIRVSASNRELQNGLKTGINQEALFNILGYPSARNAQQRTMQYNENGKPGINIQLDRNGVVNAITVNEVR